MTTCPDCGSTLKNDGLCATVACWEKRRMGQIAGRLVMETGKKLDGCGWCESAVEDRIFAALSR